MPEKPSLKKYEHVPCLTSDNRGHVRILMWNCEHECWDDEDGDDIFYNQDIRYWTPLPQAPID